MLVQVQLLPGTEDRQPWAYHSEFDAAWAGPGRCDGSSLPWLLSTVLEVGECVGEGFVLEPRSWSGVHSVEKP